MRKKILIPIMAIVLTISFVFCGGPKKPDPKPEPRYAVGQVVPLNPGSEPEWIDLEGGLANINGEKKIWFKGEAVSKYKKAARESAWNDAAKNAARSIKVIVINQFAEAWETLGVGEREDMEQVRQGLTASKTKLTVSGLETIKVFRRQVAEVLSVNPDGSLGRLGDARWQYFMQVALPYNTYVRLRDRIVNNAVREANPRQKKLISKAEKALKELDDNPREFNAKVDEKVTQ